MHEHIRLFPLQTVVVYREYIVFGLVLSRALKPQNDDDTRQIRVRHFGVGIDLPVVFQLKDITKAALQIALLSDDTQIWIGRSR